ncbi:hypothetical protein ABZ942_16690 [Nocardia sp. NPDC046473]|uniref:hypothetical protein n=1 Tax=Nocardia sp. NPDC046473 TaxID=3155733 RepID=UPI0033D59A9D
MTVYASGGGWDMSVENRPTPSPDHLGTFIRRVRAEMPESLWRVIEPWSQLPRRWVPEAYGIDVPPAGEALCEVHAPIRWHEAIEEVAVASLLHPSPTTEQLRIMWERLEAAGLRPAVCVHLGLWNPGWLRDGRAPAAGMWAVDVVGVSAIGCIEHEHAQELAGLIDGRVDTITRCPEWAYWRTC